jgi:hypothetical protein
MTPRTFGDPLDRVVRTFELQHIINICIDFLVNYGLNILLLPVKLETIIKWIEHY